jgi:L-aminoadipate-semialdehyde dehydrogenase
MEDRSKGAGVSVKQMGIYIAYLVAIGFLPAPAATGEKQLPKIELSKQARESLRTVGGRGANV